MIIESKGAKIPLREVFFLWSSSEIKRYIPGNIWSILGRTFLFEEKGITKKEIGLSLLIEAESFAIAALFVSLLSVSFVVYNFLPTFANKEVLISFIVGFLLFVTLSFIFGKFLKSIVNIPFFKHIFPDLDFITNLNILFISIIYVVLFGLGTFFAVSSVVYLDLNHITTFVGFFVFSLIVGYFSVITPTGLGVREGVMTFGLSKFISLGTAGFVSIFSRIILILSEVIFFLISYFVYKIKNKRLLKIGDFILNNKYEIFVAVSILAYTAYFTTASFLRFDNFYTGRFDLGNMDQTVWNTINGRIFQLTNPDGTNIISRLAFHSDFILVLISPFYLLWSSPKMLLLLQTIILAVGAYFVFLISKEVLKNKKISAVFAVLYLINPSLHYTNLFDFHGVTLATTFLLGSFYFLIKKRKILFLIFGILAAFTKEQVWVILSVFGLWIFFESFLINKFKHKKDIALGLSIFILSIIIFFVLVSKVIPETRGGAHFALSYYSDFGTSPIGIIKGIVFSPIKTFSLIFTQDRITYLESIFSATGYLSILAPLYIVFFLPDLIINLLSNNAQLHQIYFQYTATITPFIFISSIYGVKIIRKYFPIIPFSLIIAYLLIFGLKNAYDIGPLPGAKHANIDMFTKPLEFKDTVRDFLNSIPKKYSIAATNNIGSHISHRQKIFTIPVGIDEAEVVVFLLNDPYAQPSLKAQKEYAEKLKQDKNYIEVFKQKDFIVFEKRNLFIQKPPKVNQVKLFPLSIPALEHRDYSGGNINIEERVSSRKMFNSYIVSYSSDGLKLYALMNVPNKQKPEKGFPVIILNHGYIDPQNYSTENSYKNITDYFSSNGYIVLKPDFRGNGKSEVDNKALQRFAYPIDALNLIMSVKSIKEANKNNIYLFGHSMGGEVVLKTLEITGKDEKLAKMIKGAVVWSPVWDTVRWFSRNHLPFLEEVQKNPSVYDQTFRTIGTPENNPKLLESLSPFSYLQDVKTPLFIMHGTTDETVPYDWSLEGYNNLISLGKNAKLDLFPNGNHNLSNYSGEALKKSLDFFKAY